MYVCVGVCVCICVCVYAYVCVCVCMCMCLFVFGLFIDNSIIMPVNLIIKLILEFTKMFLIFYNVLFEDINVKILLNMLISSET